MAQSAQLCAIAQRLMRKQNTGDRFATSDDLAARQPRFVTWENEWNRSLTN